MKIIEPKIKKLTADILKDYGQGRTIDKMNALGIHTEFHVYPGLPHGFGLGIGTVAEGWIDDAVSFWEKQMNNEDN